MYVKTHAIRVTYPNDLKETAQKVKSQCTFKALQWNITGIKDNGLGQQNFLGTGHEHMRFYDIGHRISDIEPKNYIVPGFDQKYSWEICKIKFDALYCVWGCYQIIIAAKFP